MDPVTIIGGLALTAIIAAGTAAANGASKAFDADPSRASVSPESITQNVDTREAPNTPELMQHSIGSMQGARIRVRGRISNDETLRRLHAASGAELSDGRATLDQSSLDDLLARRAT